MRPHRWRRIAGSTSLVIAISPNTFVSNWRRMSVIGTSSKAPSRAVAGVVDEHADGALGELDGYHRRTHRGFVAYVERERFASPRGEVRNRLDVARRRVHVPSTRREPLGGGAADSGRASGDENCLRYRFGHLH